VRQAVGILSLRTERPVADKTSQEGLQDLGGKPRVPCAAIPKWIRQGENPLPDRYFGKHTVDEMRRRIRHASSATRRTEPTTFAREGD
jgi:hypothetical protein